MKTSLQQMKQKAMMGANLRIVDTPENEILSSELKKIIFDTISVNHKKI